MLSDSLTQYLLDVILVKSMGMIETTSSVDDMVKRLTS